MTKRSVSMTKKTMNPGQHDFKKAPVCMNYSCTVKIYILILFAFTLLSCSSMPFAKNKTESGAGTVKKTDETAKAEKTDKGERVVDSEPKPGDIKVIDGIEYIYARNKKYMLTPYEPENVWIRKDQYSPGIMESMLSGGMGKKEREDLEKRLAKLEEDLKKKGLTPQIAYPSQVASLPSPVTGNMPAPVPSFTYPSSKMRRRVIILPIVDETNYKEEHLGELAIKRLISRLENTNAIICIDPYTLNLKGQLTDPENMKTLNEVYGIQAVLKGTLSDTVTSTSFAVFNTSLLVYNTETGAILKQLSGRSPVSFSKENRDLNSEKAKVKSIDASIELIADDLLKSVLTVGWHARIASVENGKVYINAGRLSGLENGATLEVYSPGVQVMDSKTNVLLGRTKGDYKGELQVSELFGVDASWARPTRGGNFSASDLVYEKKD
jgi:hypothetical protein